MKANADIVAIVLAAGSSSRMGGQNKLLMTIDGKPLLYRVVQHICASDISKCIVVVRKDPDIYGAMLADFDVEVVVAPDADNGMSASMRAGVDAAGENAHGYLICLADMPDLRMKHFNDVLAAYHKGKIIRPKTKDGVFGHPVLFGQCYYDDLKHLSGDEGARSLIKREQANVIALEMEEAILTDLDTPEAWTDWESLKS